MNRIILVDDDTISTFLLSSLLEHLGMGHVHAKFINGAEFLEWLDSQQEDGARYVVFLDIMMPVMDGWEVMERLERNRLARSISVVMVSSSLDPTDRKKAIAHGMVLDYITKPVRAKELERLGTFME